MLATNYCYFIFCVHDGVAFVFHSSPFSSKPHVLIHKSESSFFCIYWIYCCLLPHFIAFAFRYARVCSLFSIDLVVTHLLINFVWLLGCKCCRSAKCERVHQLACSIQTHIENYNRDLQVHTHTHSYLLVAVRRTLSFHYTVIRILFSQFHTIPSQVQTYSGFSILSCKKCVHFFFN